MANNVRLFQTSDFSGGLNLRDDAYTLLPNESPDCLNVRPLPQGGWESRDSVSVTTTDQVAMLGSSVALVPFMGNGTEQIIIQTGDGTIWYRSSGTNYTFGVQHVADVMSASARMRGATMARLTTGNERLYLQRYGEFKCLRLDGTSADTVLGDPAVIPSWNGDVTAPVGGFVPPARCIVSHLGFLFVGYTVENGTTFKNRVRWSHPGEPEDWNVDDYIDVGADGGDSITALAPFGDSLLIFKHRSVWLLSGYSAETFQVVRVADNVGAMAQECVDVSRYGVAFFDAQQGVMLYDGHQVRWLWSKIAPALHDGRMTAATPTLCWFESRLFVSTKWVTATQPTWTTQLTTSNNRTFVYDIELGKGGGWYAYDYGVGPMLYFRPNSGTAALYACVPYALENTIWKLDSGNGVLGDYWSAQIPTFAPTAATSYFSTPDSTALSITGDLDLRVHVALFDWTPAAFNGLMGKVGAAGNRSWFFDVDTAGKLTFTHYSDGTTGKTKTSSVATGVADGAWKWVRVTLDVDNGAAGYDVKFYTSTDGATWVQLGTTQTGAGVSSVFDSTAAVTVGNDAVGDQTIGYIAHAKVLNGIGGTVVGEFDATTVHKTATRVPTGVTTNATVWTATGTSWDWTRAVTSEIVRTTFESQFTTAWFAAGLPGVRKRWRRPHFVVDADRSQVLTYDTFKDYSSVAAQRSGTLNVSPVVGAGDAVWGAFLWGTGVWGSAPMGEQAILRASGLGRAYAVQLRISGDTSWGLNAISLPYIVQQIR